ncbi:MAG: hypothetical protein OEW56_07740 [Gemmatimonadota bacterium]|nr:hypothetical protein [Gemmatimonadota bacterium]
MRGHVSRWLRLAAALALGALVMAAVHAMTARATGPFGRAWAHNVEREINASALFYTELGDVREFTDRRHGRYVGRGANPSAGMAVE